MEMKNNKKKVLFLIHDLGQGGAEKVLVNLVNHMDREKYTITVIALFAGGVNEQFLSNEIEYKTIFSRMIPGNSILMKIFTPKQLHRLFIKNDYDIEISYLEGPSARIVSGCTNKNTKLISWIHSEPIPTNISAGFRNFNEAKKCYESFDKTVCVAKRIKDAFCNILDFQGDLCVLYNTVESNTIIEKANEPIDILLTEEFKIVAVGSLKEIKGYDRLLRIVKNLVQEGYKLHLYLLGIGPLQNQFEEYIRDNRLENQVTLLGYQTNPYKYVSKCDLFVCSSHSEGFSTATTESLIVGTPVCTVDVSGMREMLGENNEYGVIVDNSEEALCTGIKELMNDSKRLMNYRQKAVERGKYFSTEQTVKEVEKLLDSM